MHPGTTVTEGTTRMFAERAGREGTTSDEIVARAATATSIGRLVTAAEVANVVAFLASPRSVAITGDAIASAAVPAA